MPEVLRTLKDGYWDRTTVIRFDDGTLRVRKECRKTDQPGPWAHAALRTEIAYLQSLPDHLKGHFPPLLCSWDAESIGYEIPFYEDRSDFSSFVLAGEVDQAPADEMQRQLADVVFEGIHRLAPPHDTGFADHVREVILESIDALASDEQFLPLLAPETVTINGHSLPGLRASANSLQDRGLFGRLEASRPVRLHGDLILENILWPPLLLIDPVSVAGLDSGHPLFDLVKFESFASGELYAIREEFVAAGPCAHGFSLVIDWDHSELKPFRQVDLLSTLRSHYLRAHGEVDSQLYALLDGYFSLVMARNTTGLHQWARVIKGCQCLAAAGRD